MATAPLTRQPTDRLPISLLRGWHARTRVSGPSLRHALAGLLLVAALAATTGCQNIHTVKIDAINDPSKPLGTAYRLEMHDPTGSQSDQLGTEVKAAVKDALGARGMYEAPDNAPADMIITAEYGVGPGQMKIVYKARESMMGGPIMMSSGTPKPILVFEKYIKLTAREPADGSLANPRPRGDELWSLQVSVEDEKRELAPYLTVLASTSVDYIGANSGSEKHISVEASEAAGNLRRRSAPAR